MADPLKFHVEISKTMHFVIEAPSRETLKEALDELSDHDFDGWGCDDWDIDIGTAHATAKPDMGVAGGEVLALEDYEKRLRVTPVEPVGMQKAWAFVEHTDRSKSGAEVIELPAYPHSARGTELHEKREAAGMTLGEAARAAGVGVAEWSGMELGSHVPSDWDRVFAVLKGVRHA